MAQRHTVTGRLIFALALLSLAGCSSVSTMLDPGRLDYKSASKQESSFSLESLDIKYHLDVAKNR